MNIKITDSWLREYLDTKATPEDLQKYLSLCGPSIERVEKVGDNLVYDIEITSNRVDTTSVIGIAQEANAILNRVGIKTSIKPLQLFSEEKHTIETHPITIIDEHKLCKRLLAVVISGVELRTSPQYIQDRLSAAGIRSLNNLVDITNYVMLEVGHPTHVFDYDRITTHKLIIRHAKKGERIQTLDEKSYELSESDIIIDDGTGQVIDLPGIMGTANSVVTDKTKNILFFIESNDSVAIRKSSMTYGIRTMAATLNEKSPDPYLAKTALLRGIFLYQTLAKATHVGQIVDIFATKPIIKPISVDPQKIAKKMGVVLSANEITTILQSLGCTVQQSPDNLLTITPPSSRFNDLFAEEDIIEEVARIYGYHTIPSVLQPMKYIKQPTDTKLLFDYQRIIKSYLKHAGLLEVMNYSATSLDLLNTFELNPEKHLFITNSISEDVKYLRQSLVPSLVQNMKQNEGFSSFLKLFEIAKTYIPSPSDLPTEQFSIGIAVNSSFEELKGILDGLLSELYISEFTFKTGSSPFFAHQLQGEIQIGDISVGTYGKVKNTYCSSLKLKSSVYAAELDFSHLVSCAKRMPQYKHFSQFAVIQLDLTILHSRSYVQIVEKAKQTMPHLHKISLKDTYKNTITLHFSFTDVNRNLTEKEALEELNTFKKAISISP